MNCVDQIIISYTFIIEHHSNLRACFGSCWSNIFMVFILQTLKLISDWTFIFVNPNKAIKFEKLLYTSIF